MSEGPTHCQGIVFLGSKNLGLTAAKLIADKTPGLLKAFVTCDDTRDARSNYEEILQWGAQSGIPVHTAKTTSDLTGLICSLSPRLLVVVGWYRILPNELLAQIPLGAVGVHASVLPKYRGHAPLVWALLNGESTTGVTLFHFASGVDNGDLVGQELIQIGPMDNIATILSRASSATQRLLEAHIEDLYEGCAPRRPQDESLATYCGLRRPEDGRIDWSCSSAAIHNFIRAQSRPYPGAFSRRADGSIVRILSARPFPHPFFGVPGVVEKTLGGGFLIACRNGAIMADEIVIEPDDAPLVKHGDRFC